MAREPIGGLVDRNVPSQLDEDDLRAEIELEIPDSGSEPMFTDFGDEVELIEEVAAFPNGEFDDLVDSMTQALMRYRQGNFVQLPTDDWQDEDNSARVHVYY